MANDWYGDEWGSPGWTAQKPSDAAGGTPTGTPTLPAGVKTVTVNATFINDEGAAANGLLHVVPSVSRLADPTGGSVIRLRQRQIKVKDGTGSVSLIATDNDVLTPADFTYEIRGVVDGQTITPFNVSLPSAVPAVNLASVIPTEPSSGTPNVASVLTVNDKAGPVVTLTAADVHADAAGAAAAAQTAAVSAAQQDAASKYAAVDRVSTLELNQRNLPSEQNLLDWTYDPDEAGHVTAQDNAVVAGRITLTRINFRKPHRISNIWLGLAGVDTTTQTLTNCYVGIYDAAGNLKGVTGDLSATFMNSANAKGISLPLTTPFTVVPGFHYFAMLLNGVWTINKFTFKCSGAGVSVNSGLAAPNLRYANILTGQTSLPSTLNMASQATTVISGGWGSQWYGIS
ncbi:hypothetical protein PV336_15795 [Streptomyces sp. MI02-2A]|uniref:hypothetical protein n=1 Tax=Streptomyces sp. MI02-2A TaxID=3028688 RepID=UPI0029A5BA10|nr:hypothetical protein [Streptomyces sp. MI02-2A]MDX3260682.1 hypothetical protein [Streptomyces sp. MI02-2A]